MIDLYYFTYHRIIWIWNKQRGCRSYSSERWLQANQLYTGFSILWIPIQESIRKYTYSKFASRVWPLSSRRLQVNQSSEVEAGKKITKGTVKTHWLVPKWVHDSCLGYYSSYSPLTSPNTMSNIPRRKFLRDFASLEFWHLLLWDVVPELSWIYTWTLSFFYRFAASAFHFCACAF